MSVLVWIAFVVGLTAVVIAGALLLPVLSKAFSKNERLQRGVRAALLIGYVLIILYQTLLFRSTTQHPTYQLSLFWSYRRAFAINTDSPLFGIAITSGSLLVQIILNILLYIPLGYLLPFAWPWQKNPDRIPSRLRAVNALRSFPWHAVLIGATLSVATEFTQLFFKLGLFEFDDIFDNTLGCLIGAILYQVLVRPRLQKAEEAQGGRPV